MLVGTDAVPSIDNRRSDRAQQQPSGCDTAEGTSFEESLADEDDAPSNEKLLGIAFVSFMSFSLLQLFFAWLAHSHAMVGDSVAMIVDSIAYLFNWIAERRKRKAAAATADNTIPPRNRKRTQRKLVLELEIVPPILSVSVLVVVTAIVTRSAVNVLMAAPSSNDNANPNLLVMIIFSASNLCLDMLNVFCFSKSNENMAGGRAAVNTTTSEMMSSTPTGYDRVHQNHQHDADTIPEDCHNCQNDAEGEERLEHEEDDDHHANLNMCSAFTHVFADTVRSIAVIVAAVIAMVSPAVDGSTADAVAAVVVAVLILLSLIPLLHGLRKSVAELRAIYAEEASDNMFQDVTAASDATTTTSLELT